MDFSGDFMEWVDFLSTFYNRYTPVSSNMALDYVGFYLYCFEYFEAFGMFLFAVLGAKLGLQILSEACQ